jgi:cell surface protein SprA
VQAVNIEENGNRTPIPYVVPPGIQRQRNYNNLQTNTKLNEQSLSLNVKACAMDIQGRPSVRFITICANTNAYKCLCMPKANS